MAEHRQEEEQVLEEEELLEVESSLPQGNHDAITSMMDLSLAPDPPFFLDQLPVGLGLGACFLSWNLINIDSWTSDLISRKLSLRFHVQLTLTRYCLSFRIIQTSPNRTFYLDSSRSFWRSSSESGKTEGHSRLLQRLFLVTKKGGT